MPLTDDGRPFEPPGWLDKYYDTSVSWGFVLSAAVMLFSYTLVASFLLGLNFDTAESLEKDRVQIAALLFAVFGGLAFITCAIIRVTVKWQVHPFSLGIAAALAQYFGTALASDLDFLFLSLDHGEPEFVFKLLLIPILSTFVFVLFFRWIKAFADERNTLPKMVEIAGAVAFVSTGLHLVNPVVFGPSEHEAFLTNEHVTHLMSGTPLLLGFGAIIAIRKGPVARTIWIWPVLFAVCLWGQGFTRPAYIGMSLAFGLFCVAVLSVTVVPLIRFLLKPRSGGSFAQEFYGSLDQPLLNRREFLGRDILFAAVGIPLAYFLYQTSSLTPFNWSDGWIFPIIRMTTSFQLGTPVVAVLLLAVSFFLRALNAYRFRVGLIIVTALGFVVTCMFVIKPVATFVVSPAVGLLQSVTEPSFETTVGIYIIYWLLATLLCLGGAVFAFVRAEISPDAIATVIRSVIGVTIAYPVVIYLTQTIGGFPLSESSADLARAIAIFNDDLADSVESAASLMDMTDFLAMVILVFTLVQFVVHGGSNLAMLVWPLNALVATATLNLIFAAQNDVLNSLGEQITTGIPEVLVSACVGVAVGQLFLLGKRLWYDRDPQARADAIRLRGGLLIVHGLAPLLVLGIILLSLHKFANDIVDETSQLAAVSNALVEQGQRLGEHYAGEADRVRDILLALSKEIEDAVEQVRLESATVANELTQIANDAQQAATRTVERVATEAEDAVSEAGGRLIEKGTDIIVAPVKDAIDELGFFGKILKKLADAFPDLNLDQAFGAIFSWDAGFQKIFDDFKNAAFAAMTAEFAGPQQDLIDIANRLKGKADLKIANIDTLLTSLSRTAQDAVERAEREYIVAVAYLEIGIDNLLSFINHLMVLCFFLGIALLCLLLWRVVTGLSVMIDRVSQGWAMLVHKNEAAAQPT